MVSKFMHTDTMIDWISHNFFLGVFDCCWVMWWRTVLVRKFWVIWNERVSLSRFVLELCQYCRTCNYLTNWIQFNKRWIQYYIFNILSSVVETVYVIFTLWYPNLRILKPAVQFPFEDFPEFLAKYSIVCLELVDFLLVSYLEHVQLWFFPVLLADDSQLLLNKSRTSDCVCFLSSYPNDFKFFLFSSFPTTNGGWEEMDKTWN